MRKKLFLFDIDGTLLSPGPVSRRTLDRVIADLLGQSPDLQYEDVAGSTDPIIVQRALRKIGVDGGEFNEWTSKVITEYLKRLPAVFDEADEPFVYDDTLILLASILEQDNAVGVMSGNMQAAAEIKLAKFDLLQKFPFGIYADETDDRSAMPIIARERAWDVYHEAFRLADMIIIGDTDADAKAAADNGCKSIIVSRRKETWLKAEAAGASLVVSSLADVDLESFLS